jgi:predicted Zn-dependent peptidase
LKKETAVYKRTIFPNGLKVITEAIPHVRSITLGLWIDCGSRDEEEASSGLSHFIEHMVFKGTKNRTASEIASYIESVGGVINAFTSREETCFYAKFLDEHLPLSVELIFDLINNPLFDPAEIEKEKHVVLEEIKDVDDNPSDLVHEMFAKILFNKHPLGRSILGTRRSVRNLTRTKILSHRERYYRPEKMLVAASGNLKHDQVVELVGRYINPWSFEPSSSGREKPLFKPIRKIYDRKISQTHVCLGVPAKEFNHPSRTPLMLLNLLLGGGMSSRLFQQLRENLGLAYNIFSYLDYFQDSGIFGFYLATDKRNVKRAIAAVIGELEKVTTNGISSDDLGRIKAQLKGNLMLGLENTSNRMNRMAKHELLVGRYIGLDETIESIDSVRADDIRDIARDIFIKSNFSAVTLGPTSKSIYELLE